MLPYLIRFSEIMLLIDPCCITSTVRNIAFNVSLGVVSDSGSKISLLELHLILDCNIRLTPQLNNVWLVFSSDARLL